MQRGLARGDVPDLEVLTSFRDELGSEEGWMRRYLLHAEPAAVIGDTLFVHGGLPLNAAPDGGALGSVPGAGRTFKCPREWAAALTEWARGEISNWAEGGAGGAAGRKGGGKGGGGGEEGEEGNQGDAISGESWSEDKQGRSEW